MLTRSAVFAAVAVLTVTGCVVNQTQTKPVTIRNSDLTHGNVQMNLRVGETTQADVLDIFGPPNVATIDGSQREVWSWQKNATVTQSASARDYFTIVLLGGSRSASGFEQTQRTLTLIIKFDEHKVVSEFSSRSSEF
jgi:hypothetical protein